MINAPYNAYNPQASIDRINSQIAELERLKQQIPQQLQPTNLTQNFQIAPNNNNVMRYADSMEEVQKDIVIGNTPFFSKDMSVVWIKDAQNNIKTYELKEIIPKDDKDLQIEYLQAQIEELKKGIIGNEQYDSNDDSKQIETNTTTDDGTIRTTTEKTKSSRLSKVSNSQK